MEKIKKWSFIFFVLGSILIILSFIRFINPAVGLLSVIISFGIGFALHAVISDLKEEISYLNLKVMELEKSVDRCKK